MREVAGVPAPGGRAAGERCRLTPRSPSPSSPGTRATCSRECLRSLRPTPSRLAEVWVVDNASTRRLGGDGARRVPGWSQLVALGREPRASARRSTSSPSAPTRRGSRRPTPTSSCGRARCDALLEAGERRPARGRPRAAARCCPTARRSTRSTRSRRSRSRRAFNLGLPRPARWATACASRGAGTPTRERDVDWAIGAFLLVRREAWDAAGGFDAAASGCTPRTSTSAGALRARRLDDALRAVRARPAPRRARRRRRPGATSAPLRWLRSTYSWMLRRRGPVRTRVTAAINVAGAYARARAPVLPHVGRPAPPRRLRPAPRARRPPLTTRGLSGVATCSRGASCAPRSRRAPRRWPRAGRRRPRAPGPGRRAARRRAGPRGRAGAARGVRVEVEELLGEAAAHELERAVGCRSSAASSGRAGRPRRRPSRGDARGTRSSSGPVGGSNSATATPAQRSGPQGCAMPAARASARGRSARLTRPGERARRPGPAATSGTCVSRSSSENACAISPLSPKFSPWSEVTTTSVSSSTPRASSTASTSASQSSIRRTERAYRWRMRSSASSGTSRPPAHARQIAPSVR